MSLSCVVSLSQNSGTCAAARVPVLPGRFFLSVCHGGTRWRALKTRALHTCHLSSWRACCCTGRLPCPFCKKAPTDAAHVTRRPFWSRILFAVSGCVGQLATLLDALYTAVELACTTPASSFFLFVFYTKKCACTMDWKFRRPASALPVCFCERWRKFACQW